MKERFLKVLKWFFIILGIIFFIQILFILLISAGFMAQEKMSFNKINNFSPSKNTYGKIQPIINYAEEYRNANDKYPDKISDDVKVNKKLDYKYEVSKNGTCYTITVNKDKSDKFSQYQHCKDASENSSSSSESYIEYSK